MAYNNLVLVNKSFSSSSSVVTCTTQIPFDTSIPQNTEGDEVITCTHTPLSSTNILKIEFYGFGSTTNGTIVNTALFQDSDANALQASGITTPPGGGSGRIIYLVHYMTAGTSSSTTFKIRIGPNTAVTFYANAFDSGTGFGGVSESTLVVSEYIN